jgi:hypothetical protein
MQLVTARDAGVEPTVYECSGAEQNVGNLTLPLTVQWHVRFAVSSFQLRIIIQIIVVFCFDIFCCAHLAFPALSASLNLHDP